MHRSLTLSATIAAIAAAPPAVAAPPPLQAIEVQRWISPKLPDGVTLSGYVRLAPDERHLILPVTVEDGSDQGAVANLDGSGYRCITCGRAPRATKLTALADERRLWFASNGTAQGTADQSLPGTGGTGDVQYQVLECAPSLYDCRDGNVRDVTFPIDSLAQGAQNREATPDDFGEYVAWNEVRTTDGSRVTIARLDRDGEDYVLREPRVINPLHRETEYAQDWVPAGRFYEGGDFVDGNRTLKYQTTTNALDYDTWTFDLRTGAHRQITNDIDYNELGAYSPDGRWLWYSSARGLERMTGFTAIERPALLDGVTFGQIGRVSLWNNRRCMNEGWLMDRATGQQRGGYAGQPVLLEDDWNLRQWEWFEDGRRALIQEERLPNREDPQAPAQRVKIAVVRLPALRPTRPLAPVRIGSLPWTRWSVASEEYTKLADRQLLGLVLRGRAAGTVTLDSTGLFAAGSWTATYRGYSDDGRTYLDGTESLVTPNPIVLALWTADLRVRGEHTGWMKGRVAIEPQNRFDGTVESIVDGVHRSGIPTQATCPGLRRPGLDVSVVRRQRLRGGRQLVVARVTVQPAGDASRRPVVAARVNATPRAARARQRRLRLSTTTSRGGTVRLILPRGPRARTFTLTATAGTFRDGTVRVAVPGA